MWSVDYGLQDIQSGSSAAECWVEFRNEKTGVTVSWELGGAVWVELSKWADNKKSDRSSLEILLLVLAPHVERASEKVTTAKQMREVLCRKEQLLRMFASDVLRGDFSIFPRLHEAEKENLRRRNLALFGTESGETT